MSRGWKWASGLVLMAVIGVAGIAVRFYVLAPLHRPARQVEAPRTPEAIERGRYLAHHVAACMSCHSQVQEELPGDVVAPGRFGSGRDFGADAGFPGRVRAGNLTAAPQGLGNWSDGEILRAVREGISRDGRPLFPLMPYQAYARQLSDTDALAIVAYLRTLQPLTDTVAPSAIDFPASMFIRLSPAPVESGASPLPAEPLARGRRLLDLMSCGDCHNAFDARRQTIPGREMSGGAEFQVPGKGKVYASNLTPDKETGLGTATEEDLARALRSGTGHDGRILYAMPWTAYAGLSDEDLRAVITALRALPAVRNDVPKRSFER
ncbi:MAG: c-type cytochrome [Acidobacteria bacterium]|nr:c-type cytochrome [Acidobacteriota bacterium]MCG3193804.1 Fructose dehydrogenase cytochrome subunit [Thermoanaerobaculia bacterium]